MSDKLRPGTHYYCPECGEVRGSTHNHNFEMEHNGRRVFGHYTHNGEKQTWCPGGPIDPVKDRAP